MKFLRDTWLVYQRQMLLVGRTPARLVIGFLQPIAYLLLFAPLLKNALSSTGATSYADAYRVYVPGLLVVLVLLSGFFAGFGLLAELRSGVIERSRVTPASRVALILGRALSEVTTLMGQAVVITVVAIPFGLTVDLGWLLVAYVMLALMALMACGFSYAIAMLIPSPAALGPLINTISQPLSLLSGVLLPLTLAPAWLVGIAEWNPIYWTTNGTRALFTGNPGDPAVWQGMVVIIVLAAITVTWATKMFAKQVR
ncbi:ABC transporter permease [Actinokineospora sp. NBRC 105648]|uniref:ABC transporter permease n=1 Tax=Actinokineospora sp. NBRC 105648 TaxID=3032206 RepID=UPI0024A5EAD9|nr:ABC transporter permease [Actinokineospora sp. NBRC 105648]GLZ39780.1 transport permease protein [Actinokineospora sp. NBRC 105648]